MSVKWQIYEDNCELNDRKYTNIIINRSLGHYGTYEKLSIKTLVRVCWERMIGCNHFWNARNHAVAVRRRLQRLLRTCWHFHDRSLVHCFFFIFELFWSSCYYCNHKILNYILFVNYSIYDIFHLSLQSVIFRKKSVKYIFISTLYFTPSWKSYLFYILNVTE